MRKAVKEFEAWGDIHWGTGEWDHVPTREVLSSLEAWKFQEKKIDALMNEIARLKTGK